MSQLGSFSSLTGIVKSLAADIGSATPTVLGVITIAGGNNIGTSAALNTLTINLDGTTNHAVQVGNASGSLTSLAIGATGTMLTGVTGADPTWTTATYPSTTAIGDVLIATAANTISGVSGATTSGYVLTANGGGTSPTFQAIAAGGMLWSREVNAAVAAAQGHGYVNTNAGLTTFTLPAVAALGTVIEILGESVGLWTIAQNAGQSIQYGNLSTTVGVGGFLAASNRYDTVRIICRVASTTWSVASSTGVLNVV